VLALLDTEGAPQWADIGALFTLAHGLFDGSLIKPQATGEMIDAERPKGLEEATQPVVAVWPPQPDCRELRKKIGKAAAVQLQWFQQILQTLLQNETPPEHAQYVADMADFGDEEGQEEQPDTEARRADEEGRASRVAEKIWNHAQPDYERLRNRLMELYLTPDKAPNIWPAAIIAFLTTMAVFRKAGRMAPDFDFGTTAEVLCDDFVRVMLNPRKQRDDFCCPKGFRYSNPFPPIADDLRNAFNIELDSQLATVMLALIVDQKMRSPEGLYPLLWPRYMRQVCNEAFMVDANAREACRRVWRLYVCDETGKVSDADFEKTFDVFCDMRSAGATS
jgi:hypothetical protein